MFSVTFPGSFGYEPSEALTQIISTLRCVDFAVHGAMQSQTRRCHAPSCTPRSSSNSITSTLNN